MTAHAPLPDPGLDLLSAAEAADLLRCSERHVWRHKSAGALPPVHIGRRVYFHRADVLALIRGPANSRDAQAEAERRLVAEMVAAAPHLTADQRRRLASLLAPADAA